MKVKAGTTPPNKLLIQKEHTRTLVTVLNVNLSGKKSKHPTAKIPDGLMKTIPKASNAQETKTHLR